MPLTLVLFIYLLFLSPMRCRFIDNSSASNSTHTHNIAKDHLSRWNFVNNEHIYHDQYTVVRAASNGSAYMLIHHHHLEITNIHNRLSLKAVPDIETITYLEYNQTELPFVEDEVLNRIKLEAPVPSFKLAAYNPDELMRCKIQKVRAITESSRFIKSTVSISNILNPSITALKDNKNDILICWYHHWSGGDLNSNTPSPLYFGLLSKDDFRNKTIESSNIRSIKFKDSDEQAVNRFPFKGDPRLTLLPNGSISIIYCTVVGRQRKNVKFYQVEIIANFNSKTYELELLDNHIFVLDQIKYPFDHNQKNWVPFVYKNDLNFIQQLNPLYIIKSAGLPNPDNHFMQVINVSDSHMYYSTPWKSEYGNSFRGGTPLVFLPKQNLYLAFFHTSLTFQNGYNLVTYFMGAMTFSTEPPFKVYSMSMYPIIFEEWLYTAPWTTSTIDYVVFPTGLILDEDQNHAHMTMGWQDKDAIIVNMEIEPLLATLVPIKYN